MGDPVTISAALLFAGTTAQVGSGIAEAAGDARAQSFKASEAAVAARHGKIAAAETDTALREELSSTIGNIRAIRASAGIGPGSPTTDAIIESEGKVSDRERRIRVANILGQVGSDERSATFLRQSSRDTFLYGTGASIGRGFSSLARA